MNKYIPLISLACLLPLPCEAAPVTWDFVATGCAQGGFFSSCVSGQAYPVTIATFTLPGPDSSGTAIFGGIGPFSTYPAKYTGDSFVLDYSLNNYHPLTPAFTQSSGIGGECEAAPAEICDFSLSWTETAGHLDALHLYVNMTHDSFLGSLGGATVASDNTYISGAFSGCEEGSCRLSGGWFDSPASVPEPSHIPLSFAIAAGFLGLVKRYGRAV